MNNYSITKFIYVNILLLFSISSCSQNSRDELIADINNPLCILNNANFDIINFSIKDKFVDILNHDHCCNFG